MKVVAAGLFVLTAVRKGLAFAKGNCRSWISWEVGDIQAIAHPAESFDTVISCEHHRARSSAKEGDCRTGSRAFMPGGKLFLTTPNDLGTLGLYRMYLRLLGGRGIPRSVNRSTTSRFSL